MKSKPKLYMNFWTCNYFKPNSADGGSVLQSKKCRNFTHFNFFKIKYISILFLFTNCDDGGVCVVVVETIYYISDIKLFKLYWTGFVADFAIVVRNMTLTLIYIYLHIHTYIHIKVIISTYTYKYHSYTYMSSMNF